MTPPLKLILEAGLLAAGETLSLGRLLQLFPDDAQPSPQQLREALDELAEDYNERAMELVELGGGFRMQVRVGYAEWVSRLWEERPGHYSRALLETLALIAYRQPITRGEISEVRGVSVSTSMVRTLQERGWVKVVGHREVPGRPALYGTTSEFLDYFSLKGLGELPPLAEPRELGVIGSELVEQGVLEALPVIDEAHSEADVASVAGEASAVTEAEQQAELAEAEQQAEPAESEQQAEPAESEPQTEQPEQAEPAEPVAKNDP